MRQSAKDLISFWHLTNKFIPSSLDVCFQWCSLCGGVFVHWLMLLLRLSCVFLELAALCRGNALWGRIDVVKVCEHSLTFVVS